MTVIAWRWGDPFFCLLSEPVMCQFLDVVHEAVQLPFRPKLRRAPPFGSRSIFILHIVNYTIGLHYFQPTSLLRKAVFYSLVE